MLSFFFRNLRLAFRTAISLYNNVVRLLALVLIPLLAAFLFITFYYLLHDLLLNVIPNKTVVEYLLSILILILIYYLSSEKVNSSMEREIERLYNSSAKNSWVLDVGSPIVFYLFILIPKRTIIYIFYLLILLYNQLHLLYPDFNFIDNYPGLSEFIRINEYTIVLLIALDRIVTNFHKEKKAFKGLKILREIIYNNFKKVMTNLSEEIRNRKSKVSSIAERNSSKPNY